MTNDPLGPVAIDYTPALEQGGGIGRYVRELTRALAHLDTTTDYRLFAAGQRGEPSPPPGRNFAWRTTPISVKWFARLWHRARLPLPVEWWVGPVNIFHATDFTLPPAREGTRTLLTVHDLSFIHTPETAAPSLRAYLNRVVPRSVARADHILADSEATRQDVIAAYGTPAEKISVLYCGVEERFRPVEDATRLAEVRRKYGLAGPFVLSVGTVQPRKNYARLAEALHRLRRPEVTLAIAGGKGWLTDALYTKIEELGMREQVRFLGYVPDDDLIALYSAARGFALPSLYEGFGLPPLEAMACGLPVLTSNASSLPEVVGDAGITVDPTDVDAIAAGLLILLDDNTARTGMITRGIERAGTFRWEEAARQLRQHYANLLR